MDIGTIELNWIAVAVSVVAAQIISTLWFTVLFGDGWAKEYGASSKQEHTKEIPGYTYAVQLLCTAVLVFALALLQSALGLGVSIMVAIGICVATNLPGQAFLKRWRVAAITIGCQCTLIVAISLILGMWS